MTLRDAIGAMMRAVSPYAGSTPRHRDAGMAEERGRAALLDTAAKVHTAADQVIRKARESDDVIRDFVHSINAERQREIVRRGE